MPPTDPPETRATDNLAHELLKSRTILVSGEVNERLAERTIAKLLVLDGRGHEPIRLVLSSPGGHVESGFAIHDVMKFIQAPITVIGAGWVASIAVPILFGAPRKSRFALPLTRFLIHQPWSSFSSGQASDISIVAKELLKLRERLNKMIADETGQAEEKVRADSDRDFWLNAQEAKDYGLIDRIIGNAAEI
jgi:ATP-dependent Clp protease protease subunit